MKLDNGLAVVKEMYENRDRRARELRNKGKKVIGYMCALPPAEIITATDSVPYRIAGKMKERQTAADKYIEPLMCGLVRSYFDLGLKGKYDFLDGVVVPHACNNMDSQHCFWRSYIHPDYVTLINVPHVVSPPSIEFFSAELANYRKSLENFTGNAITDQRLREAIELHNENRSLLRELCLMRKQDPPLISGSEMIQVVMVTMSIPVEEANKLVRGVIREVASRQQRPAKKTRVLVTGMVIDNVDFIEFVEDCGTNVVMGDLCTDSRVYWRNVKVTDSPLDALAARYLGIPCSRTYREGNEAAFGHIGSLAKDFNAAGVIAYVLKYCDSFKNDLPDLADYLRGVGIPLLIIEDDYSMGAAGAIKVRVQAFVEMIGQASA